MIYEKIYPLADTLQIEIKLYKKAQEYELRGEREFSFPLSKQSDFKVKAIISASTVAEDTASVLVKVLGDLWLFLVYNQFDKDDGELVLYVLNMHNKNTQNVKKAVDGQTLETAMMAITPMIVKVFHKGAKEVTWLPLGETKAVA